jgi:hypothetical protein
LNSFIAGLFYDAAKNPDYIAGNDWMKVNNELAGMWKEAVVASLTL